MIHDVDGTLRRLLLSEMAKIPGNPIRDDSQISFDSPSTAEESQDRSARLNLYLHDVRENRELRDEGYTTFVTEGERPSAGRRPAPIRLDLSYLITAYAGDDPMTEHRLLGDTLASLLRFQAAPEDCLAGALEGLGSNSVLLRVAQPDLMESNDPTSLWQALGGRLRPAISVTVTMPFNAYETVYSRKVREAILGLGQGVPPEGPRKPLEMVPVWISIAGMVLDQVTERPIAAASLTLSGSPKTLFTNDDGFFYSLNLKPGTYRLRCKHRGYAAQEQTIAAPAPGRPDLVEPMVFALRPLSDAERAAEEAAAAEGRDIAEPTLVDGGRTYTQSGVLRHADGRPAPFVTVRMGQQVTSTDASGAYVFVNVPPGDHPVVAELPGEEPKEVIARDGTAALPPQPASA